MEDDILKNFLDLFDDLDLNDNPIDSNFNHIASSMCDLNQEVTIKDVQKNQEPAKKSMQNKKEDQRFDNQEGCD